MVYKGELQYPTTEQRATDFRIPEETIDQLRA